jgi:hypothetical protein
VKATVGFSHRPRDWTQLVPEPNEAEPVVTFGVAGGAEWEVGTGFEVGIEWEGVDAFGADSLGLDSCGGGNCSGLTSTAVVVAAGTTGTGVVGGV